jgi:UDP-N-acetylmuramoyl-tripeptide--D-alanyl-D-alanine ligase
VKGLEGDEDILLFELGEYYPGDVKLLAELVRPNVDIITGVTKQHMERFKSLEAARNTVFELADFLGDKPLYVNGESEDATERIRPGNLTYSKSGADDWKVGNAKTSLEGTSFTATKGKKVINAKSQLLGLHQIGPLVATIAIANHLGMKSGEIEKGVADTKPFEHRLQPTHNISGVTVIDDTYNGNLEGFRVTIAFLGLIKAKRKVYVTPGIVEVGEFKKDIHIEIGKMLAKTPPDVVVLMRNSATPYIEEGMKSGGYKGELIWQDDPLGFYSNLQAFAVPGDVIALQNDWGDSYS